MIISIKKADTPIPDEITKAFTHQHRATEFFSSRWALSDCLTKLHLKAPISLLEFELENYSKIKQFPQLLLSLSHTGEFGAAVVTQNQEIQGIGIDIELRDRPIKGASKKMFINSRDSYNNLLEIWCQKEAAYKALWPNYHGDKTLVLKDIWVKDQYFGLIQDETIQGRLESYNGQSPLMCWIASY